MRIEFEKTPLPIFSTGEIPVIPKLPPEEKWRIDNPDPNPVVAICGECLMEIRQVMGYCCSNRHCPWQRPTLGDTHARQA